MRFKFIKRIIIIPFFLITVVAVGQTTTMNGVTADWTVASNWVGNEVGNTITENVILSTNANPTVSTALTIGTLTGNGDNLITINASSSLTLGASGNAKNLQMNGNNPKITVNSTGVLTVWGNVAFVNKVVWEIYGTVIVKGNVSMPQGANLKVYTGGLFQVEGNLSTGSNSDFDVNGTGVIRVYQNFSVTSGNLNGNGTFEFGGTCSSSGGSWCNSNHHNTNLPVELMYFKGANSSNQVLLTWATASEKNFDQFGVEHSANGDEFHWIGALKGAGNSNQVLKYSFTHHDPSSGKNYYRLRSIDFDQSFDFSKVIMVEAKVNEKISVFPNPVVGGKFSVTLDAELAHPVEAMLINTFGTMVWKSMIDKSGDFDLTGQVKSGVFFLKVMLPEGESFKRIIVK